jgi:hypothetical protein
MNLRTNRVAGTMATNGNAARGNVSPTSKAKTNRSGKYNGVWNIGMACYGALYTNVQMHVDQK